MDKSSTAKPSRLGWRVDALARPRRVQIRDRLRLPEGSRILILAVALIPILSILFLLLMVLWISLGTGVPGESSSFTLSNYRTLFGDTYMYRIMGTSVIYATVTVGVAIPLGFLFAWLIERTDLPYKTAAAGLVSMGILIPTFLKAMGWVLLLHPRIGIVNTLLMSGLGLSTPPLSIGTIYAMGFFQGITLTPLAYVMIAAALRNMNPALVEAAAVHGVGRFRSLLGVELGLVWPVTFATAIYLFTIAISAFDIPAIVGIGNNIFTFSTALYFMVNPTEGLPRYGLASAFGTVMIIASLVLMIPYFVALNRGHRYAVISGKGYQQKPVELGWWTAAAWAIISAYVVIAFVLPVIALTWISLLPFIQMPSAEAVGSLSLDHYKTLFLGGLIGALGNTLFLMFVVPTAVVLLSIAVSWVVTRSQWRGGVAVDAIAFLPHPVPNLLFALSVLYVALLVADFVPIYGTIYAVMAVYIVCGISFGTRMVNGTMIQVHRELEEAGQVGGVRAWGILCKVIVPLIRPGLVYAWIWISLLAYRELTLAVFLTSPDSQVVSTFIWSRWGGGSLGEAAAAAIFMVLVMSPLVIVLWLIARRRVGRVFHDHG